MTIFYKGKLKRTRTPEDIFAKIRPVVKPKGITKSWSIIADDENCLTIDFGDNKSETLSFIFNDKTIDDFCKVAFDEVGGEKELEAVFNLFYSVLKMFSVIEISDDFGLWDDYMESKRFKIKLRELTDEETARVTLLYDAGFTYFKDLLWKMIADDLNAPYEKFDYPDYVKRPELYEGKLFLGRFECYKVLQPRVQEWLHQTAAYKDRGRIAQYSVSFWYGSGYRLAGEYNEVSELEFAVAAVDGAYVDLLMSNLTEYKRLCGSFGQKHLQEMRFFEEKFLPIFNAETDMYKQCLLAYRFLVSVYDFAGFKFVGKE